MAPASRRPMAPCREAPGYGCEPRPRSCWPARLALGDAGLRGGEHVTSGLMVFHGPFGVFLDQVSVDRDRRCGSGAGRGNHLGPRIDHVAGGPATGGAGPAGGIDSDEASRVDLAAQAGQQAAGVRPVTGPDEHRSPRDHLAIAATFSSGGQAALTLAAAERCADISRRFGLSSLPMSLALQSVAHGFSGNRAAMDVVAPAAVRAESSGAGGRLVTYFEPSAGAERPLRASCPVQFGDKGQDPSAKPAMAGVGFGGAGPEHQQVDRLQRHRWFQ